MKHVVFCCLIVCSIVLCLTACAPQEPMADVYAIRIGDTEKQVIEKAGDPDFKKGIGKDVFGYTTNEFETEAKLFWIRDEKVVMTAMVDVAEGNEFLNWEIDKSYVFQSIKRPKEIWVWEPGLDIYDIMGYFGPKFSFWEFGYSSSITYELEDGASIKIRFYMNLIQDATYIEKDGKESILWELGQNGSYLQ